MNDILPILFFITFPFVDNVCTLNYSSCESAIWWEIEKSGVKTRPSEQTVLPVEADLLLGPDSSPPIDSCSEYDPNDYSNLEESKADGLSCSPIKVPVLIWQGFIDCPYLA